MGTEAFPNTHVGRARVIAWAARRTGGDLAALWVIEGISSYGAQLARQAAPASASPTRSTSAASPPPCPRYLLPARPSRRMEGC